MRARLHITVDFELADRADYFGQIGPGVTPEEAAREEFSDITVCHESGLDLVVSLDSVTLTGEWPEAADAL